MNNSKHEKLAFTASDVIEYIITAYEMMAAFVLVIVCISEAFYRSRHDQALETALSSLGALLLIGLNSIYLACILKSVSTKQHILIRYECRAVHSLFLMIEGIGVLLIFILATNNSPIPYIFILPPTIYEIWKYNKNLKRLKIVLYERLKKNR